MSEHSTLASPLCRRARIRAGTRTAVQCAVACDQARASPGASLGTARRRSTDDAALCRVAS